MMLAVALLGLPLTFLADHSQQRRDRRLEIADRHARVGAEYRRNAQGDSGMIRIADWHEFMRAEFERAAGEPWRPIPKSQIFPLPGWVPAKPADQPRK